MLEAEVVCAQARHHAREIGTARLRWAERSVRRRVDRLTLAERGYLEGLRDELRDRGIDLPELDRS